MIAPPLLEGRDRYERLVEGWVDAVGDDAVAHTVRLGDPDAGIELTIVALPSPHYEIRAASARALAGVVDGGVLAGVPRLAGTRMVSGLTRRAAEAVGEGAGARLVVDAVVEAARLARQVARIPRERAERAADGDPWACWELDMSSWVDIPGTCFAFSDAGRRLFGTRPIVTSMRPDFYSPRPGQRRVFERVKRARLERRSGRLLLAHTMDDNAHHFELTYEIDLETARITRADSVTPRLPYLGICSEPQAKIVTLVGERVDEGLRTRVQTLLGGVTGCAQLYDLTADLLKLLTAPREALLTGGVAGGTRRGSARG